MKMAQSPPDQNYYHSLAHSHPQHYPQLQLPPQFRNPFDLFFDEHTGAINYNYIRSYIPYQLSKPDDISDSLVFRRRQRTIFTSAQIAVLEEQFLQGKYLTNCRVVELSGKLALSTAQVKVWFKNRRRRQKIQSDQQKQLSCERKSVSPSVPNSAKSETNGSASSCSSNSSGLSTSGRPSSLQSLSLNSSGTSTPNSTPLTPSPTPTTPIANFIEHYGESVLNPYYYNNHPHHHQVNHTHATLTHPYAGASTQYYTQPRLGNLQHHHHQQYHTTHPHHFQMQHKLQMTTIKEVPDVNFSNPYYIHMSTSLTENSTAVEASTEMSLNSEVYELLTTKNDKNPSLCNDVGSGDLYPSDDSNETKAKLQVLVTNNANYNDETSSMANPIGSQCSSTDAFAKFQKISSDSNDSNFQCTMDTLMHAYNNHRNTSTNTQQFATYCYN